MKMVKSLLLGTAAGLVAMSGAQAADLPVKAKPVQYVKICSLYGAGFYYIPGTDMCLKIGGWVRQQIGYNVNGSLTSGPLVENLNTRATQQYAQRSRGYITADARNQTEYGTVRSYIAVGVSGNPDPATGASAVFSANRAFIQFAGFTFGITQSFYDFYVNPAVSFYGGLINGASDTGDGGKAVTTYTAQFGQGFSASIGVEGQRNAGVINTNGTALTSAFWTGGIASSQKGETWPDVVGNLRLDGPWGAAQVMGAIHDASGQYQGTTAASPSSGNAVGFAVGAGVRINTPSIGTGDYFQTQFNYAQGASGFVNISASSTALYDYWNGTTPGSSSLGAGLWSDSVYGSLTNSIELTTAWGVNASYEHFWNKSFQTSVYGSYEKTTYNTNANAMLCAYETGGTAPPVVGGTSAVGVCNNNWAVWNVGSRTQWNVDSQTAMGLDIVYQRLVTANGGLIATVNAPAPQVSGTRNFADQGQWIGQFRIHRNFYP